MKSEGGKDTPYLYDMDDVLHADGLTPTGMDVSTHSDCAPIFACHRVHRENVRHKKSVYLGTGFAVLGIWVATRLITLVTVFTGLIPMALYPFDKHKEKEISAFSNYARRGGPKA